MSTMPLSGSLVFAEEDGIACTSGLINGRVGLSGPLSKNMITLGLGLRLVPGCWQWQTEVETGGVAVFSAGDEHSSLYGNGALYVALQLSAERLEAEAGRQDLILDQETLGGSRIHDRLLDKASVQKLAIAFRRIHDGAADKGDVVSLLLAALIQHLARQPVSLIGRAPDRHAEIVRRAREFIHANLSEPLSLDAIVAAAGTSRRTLNRAFDDILGDTPQAYVRRVRLHRIRQALADDVEAACTITLIANQWGIGEVGRLAGRYRELFGELPSETLARSRETTTDRAS
ncbi:AraC family transcriptional regulator [Mesorhizobium sp. BR1-1-16]|uniref:helix-turn-helix domain-containing protein n=1 Tax=Mesorhizobium sp. BR1-1-16 TaxID=2876653 RepID=UPI001CC9EA5D|nr:AraC family transcriptional regulator [Mesorhizobium sp. BR1-1-16]MBZ9934674.1 AraC family transcriptional regulator [Mesorhizobium sp. BR1-1-16]